MKKYENFCCALDNLGDVFNYDEPYSSLTLTGLAAYYGICFEQAWKAMKEILLLHGVSEGQTGSPRQVLKAAYQVGMIKDEQLWIDAMVTRNNVAHSYNREVAIDIVNLTKQRFYDMFRALKAEIEANWL